MRSVWHVDGAEVCSLQGLSADFVRLMNALITAQGRAGGLQDVAIKLNQADTVADGGVDAAVSDSITASQDPTGWFAVPTCWQFKAQPTSNIKPSSKAPDTKQETALREEINKPYAAELIKKGYGYRFCIADDTPATSKGNWENWLNDEAKKLNPTAEPAFVLTASDLASWVNRHPAIVRRFKPSLQHLKPLADWQREIRGLTPTFVKPSSWPQVSAKIVAHCNFGQTTNTVLTIQGEAGVGKTRMVCEALSTDHAIEALIAATSDEQKALDFAHAVASDPNARAILVADECSLQYRERLRQILPGCHQRFRIIAIDNSLQRAGATGEIELKQLKVDEVFQVLNSSFPSLPSDRRRSFAELASGFIRLAVDLCNYNHLIPIDGKLEGIFGLLHDSYLIKRLSDDELAAIQLVSLLPRVGYRDDVASELKQLSAHPAISCDPQQIIQIATRLKHSPGFVAFGGRYLYVTPKLIAQVAFQSAWVRWVAPNPQGFLKALPPNLLDGFVKQAGHAPEHAKTVSDFFLKWATKLGPPDLAYEAQVDRLVRLVETDPEIFLPLLQALIERIPSGELQSLHTRNLEGQNARRQLVWLAEKLAHLPEYFASAERILLMLALAESEPHLGNNATKIWTALYRIVLSGTSIPFLDRLKLLESRLRDAQATQLPLGIAAFDEILTTGPVMGLPSPPVILGRVPPPVWRPTDNAEIHACRLAGLEMASRLCAEGGPIGDALRTVVVERLSPLMLAGYFEQIEAIFGHDTPSDQLLAVLTRELEDFTDTFCRDREVTVQRRQTNADGVEEMVAVKERYPRKVSPDLEARIREWYSRLIPKTLHGRLVSVVGRDAWQQEIAGDRAEWQREMDELAHAFIKNPPEFDSEISWLASAEARSGYHLGQSMGKADAAGALLENVFNAARHGAIGVARGYLDQASTSHESLLDRLNAALDSLQLENARSAFEVLWSAGPPVRKIERFFAMVDAGQLPAEFLRSLEREVDSGHLDRDQFAGAVNRMIDAAEAGNSRAAAAAVRLLYARLHPDRRASGCDHLKNAPDLIPMLHRALRVAISSAPSESTFSLILAEDLAAVDVSAGSKLLAAALTSREYNTRELAEKHLIELAAHNPEDVMKAVGDVLLHPTDRVWLQIGDVSNLVQAIPEATVRKWIDDNGLPAAQLIARHLIPPHISNGQPVVPTLTAYVLDKFEADDGVFREFLAGTHSGQVYFGDIAAQHLQEAQTAQKFIAHPLKRIREWAQAEITDARRQADFWKQQDEEDYIR